MPHSGGRSRRRAAARAAAQAFLLAALLFAARAADTTKPSWKSFDEGIKEAHSSNKIVLVDVYTGWCGWCKRMDKDVYSNRRVVDLLADRFVAVKLDAESSRKLTYKGQESTEMGLAQGFGVDGYPATIFLEPSGEGITLVPGYIPADSFAPILEYIGGGFYKKMKWDEFQKRSRSDTTGG